MKTSIDRNAHVSQTDAQRLADLDALVARASRGDRRAIGAIAIAFGPRLLSEAQAVMGPFEQDADDVLQDFLLALLEGRNRFVPDPARAIPWMVGIVRATARKYRADREREWRTDREP
jgi:DNA-directed RNA polymerase specialized sigma24 family protein